jgi:hypothetical protein
MMPRNYHPSVDGVLSVVRPREIIIVYTLETHLSSSGLRGRILRKTRIAAIHDT